MYDLLDVVVAFLQSPDTAVQDDDELAGANGWPKTMCLRVSAQSTLYELNEEGVVGNGCVTEARRHTNL